MEKDMVYCPVSFTIRMFGGKYKALILWRLMEGTHRYSDMRRAVPEATAKMLTQQLRELEEDGLIERVVYPVVPPKVEYSLSVRGASLRPVLEAIYAWGSDALEADGHTPNCTMTQCSCIGKGSE